MNEWFCMAHYLKKILNVNWVHVWLQGGFCIEAGRRCDSGEGLFTFLTRDGPQIFKAIVKQCSLQKKNSEKSSSVKKKSSLEASSLGLPPTVCQTAATPIYSLVRVPPDTGDSSVCQYSEINFPTEESMKHLGLIQPYLSSSKEEVGEEGKEEEEENKDEDDRCHSLEALDQDDTEHSIYYNLRKTTPPLTRKTETDDFQCIYSETKSSSSSDLQHLNPPLRLEPSSFTYPSEDHFASAKPQSLHLPPTDTYNCAEYNTQAVDDMKDPEEAVSSTAQSKAPGSFKQRLAEIISKDLAKFQPAPPYGAGSPTFFQ